MSKDKMSKDKMSRINSEDRIENEVRKRMAERLSSAGVDSGRISMEVLYWLPPDFVRLYMDLVSRALRMDAGVSSGIQGMVGDEGQVKASVGTGPTRGKTAGGLFTESMTAQGRVDEVDEDGKPTGRTRGVVSGAHASGGGKRYRQHWLIRDEDAMELKTAIDRGLRKLAGRIQDRQGAKGPQPLGVVGGGTPGASSESHGVNLGESHGVNLRAGASMRDGDGVRAQDGDRVLVVSQSGQKRCRTCGKIASRDWVTCPHLHN